jgi:membrane-associated phospholipid phosphatase
MFSFKNPPMQSIQKFSRRPVPVCVRISRVALIGFLPLVSFAQQVQPPSDSIQVLSTQESSSKAAQDLPEQPAPQPGSQAMPCNMLSPGVCFREMAKDQRGIVTSPMRIEKRDLKWLLPGAALVGTAFALDHTVLQNVSTDPTRVHDYRRASNLTGIYIPVAAAGTALFAGTVRHDEHLRETGALAMRAMADTQLLTSFLKFASDRTRPQANGLTSQSGAFWAGHSSSADSFPSGHTANAFAVAHVIADEYPGWKVKLAVYSLAAATGFERIQGREHFPSDVLVGGAIGYLVGGYIFDHHSSRSKTHVAFAPMVGRGEAGISLRISRGDNP